MRNMLEELVDNILLCLNSLIVEPLKPEVTKARDACLSQLATLLLSCCAGWGATIAHAVLEEKGENIIGIVFSVISITRAEATDENRRETVNILVACFRVLNLVMFCDESAKKTVTLFARNSPVSLMELLRTFTEDNLVVQVVLSSHK
ncbi:hypothetical protein TELCIR_23581 [Teladorsagia circumcincta]|uniref:Uncharacterized protein n=1 Tax=Teladorsagia circumcincta TaxID=45464 RepID=A0A2G9TAX0_TELCI|nr:hypothetical protein TELCIR_23581 [Teladorsagia circumcincta]